MAAIVAMLYVAGGVLPLWGLVLAVVKGRRKYRELAKGLHFIDRVATRSGPEPTQHDIDHWIESYGMKEPEAPHKVQWMYAPQIAQMAIWRDLREPAYFAGAGIVLGTAGSLLSLTL
jgi:hypothetical protein